MSVSLFAPSAFTSKLVKWHFYDCNVYSNWKLLSLICRLCISLCMIMKFSWKNIDSAFRKDLAYKVVIAVAYVMTKTLLCFHIHASPFGFFFSCSLDMESFKSYFPFLPQCLSDYVFFCRFHTWDLLNIRGPGCLGTVGLWTVHMVVFCLDLLSGRGMVLTLLPLHISVQFFMANPVEVYRC